MNSKRKVIAHTETELQRNYDYEDNPYETEVEVEILSAFEGDTLLWSGTVHEAHRPSSGATSDYLPTSERSNKESQALQDDALWSLVAPHAMPLVGATAESHQSRQVHVVGDIGGRNQRTYTRPKQYADPRKPSISP